MNSGNKLLFSFLLLTFPLSLSSVRFRHHSLSDLSSSFALFDCTPSHSSTHFPALQHERKKGGLKAVRGATKPQRPQTPPLFSGCLEFCFAQTEKQLLLSRSLPLLMLKPNPKTWFLRMIVLLVWSKMSEALFCFFKIWARLLLKKESLSLKSWNSPTLILGSCERPHWRSLSGRCATHCQ